MLRLVVDAIRAAGRPLCLADLSRDTGIEESALEGMVDTLVARGRLRAIPSTAEACEACPISSGCFLMDDRVATMYALPVMAPVARVEQAASAAPSAS